MKNNDLYELENLSFIAGDYITIEFTVYDGVSDVLADITAFTVSCVIAELGQPSEIVLEKQGVKSGDGIYRIELNSNETIGLIGKYVYQPLIVVNETKEYRPAQGILTIVPANN